LLNVGVDPLERDEARSLPVMGDAPGLVGGADADAGGEAVSTEPDCGSRRAR
jgi:hypothetical protein